MGIVKGDGLMYIEGNYSFFKYFFKKREITLKNFYKDVSYKRMLQHIHGNVIGMV